MFIYEKYELQKVYLLRKALASNRIRIERRMFSRNIFLDQLISNSTIESFKIENASKFKVFFRLSLQLVRISYIMLDKFLWLKRKMRTSANTISSVVYDNKGYELILC